ncbi:hypothetical protein BDD12DRAFT_767790, partial [Trichophaea hybrida]
IRAMVCYSLMARFQAHNLATMKYLSLYLEEIHRSKEVFQPFQTTKGTKEQMDEYKHQQWKELLKQYCLEDQANQTNNIMLTPAQHMACKDKDQWMIQ